MKRTKYRKYQAPQLKEACLETEGFLCQSFGLMISARELENMNSVTGDEAEPFYLEY